MENNNTALCSLINRGNAGTLWLGTSGYVSSTATNLGEVSFSGVDVSASYAMDVMDGTLKPEDDCI